MTPEQERRLIVEWVIAQINSISIHDSERLDEFSSTAPYLDHDDLLEAASKIASRIEHLKHLKPTGGQD